MTTLAALRAKLRIDLHDEDTVKLWTDAHLDQYIERAAIRYSQVSPLEDLSGFSTSPNSREFSIASLSDRLRVVAVEHPTGEFPRRFVPFSLWQDTITMDLETAPAGVEPVDVYWHRQHAFNPTDWPVSHDELVLHGAAGYASAEWSVFAANRVNVGGGDAWGSYDALSVKRLAQFERELDLLPAANILRKGRMFSPQRQGFRSESTDPGPS